MKKEKKEKHFVHKPHYPGGREALQAFVQQNLRYPTEAQSAKVEGTVSLKYDIDYQGKVIKTKVISGLGYGCDEEAERIVRLLEFEVPKNRKIKVVFHKDIQIHFRLPKKVSPATPIVSYQITTKKTETPSAKKKQQTYTYTVTVK